MLDFYLPKLGTIFCVFQRWLVAVGIVGVGKSWALTNAPLSRSCTYTCTLGILVLYASFLTLMDADVDDSVDSEQWTVKYIATTGD